MQSKIFLITGANSGLGQAFAVEAIAAGHKVIGTVRQASAKEEFDHLKAGYSFGTVLDVTEEPAVIEQKVAEMEAQIGPIDVLINNAGYGHEGTVEESPLAELRRQFEVNVFGVVSLIKAVLPFMRQRRRGHIINITSMGGLVTMPGVAYYHGSKFALEGISGSLSKELKSFGIHVTAVEPGMFRTDWAGRSMVRSGRQIADYDAIFDPLRQARLQRNGKQPGDPSKAGRAILKVVEAPNPPTHLILGPDALQFVNAEREKFDDETRAWKDLSRSTDFS